MNEKDFKIDCCKYFAYEHYGSYGLSDAFFDFLKIAYQKRRLAAVHINTKKTRVVFTDPDMAKEASKYFEQIEKVGFKEYPNTGDVVTVKHYPENKFKVSRVFVAAELSCKEFNCTRPIDEVEKIYSVDDGSVKSGDVVVLNSGGPHMMVISDPNTSVLCSWKDNGKTRNEFFLVNSISKINKEDL